jgi:rod shape-determining protein MreD
MSKDRASRNGPVAISILVAMLLMLAPMPGWAAPFRPDWIALTLIYWSMNLPRTYGVGIAWLIGIFLDVAQGTLLAQHALALSLIAFLTIKFHLQLRVFPVSQMAATVLALLAIYRFVLFWINGIAGVDVPAVTYWGPVVTGALVWPLVATLLRALPYRARSRA